jgi:hypothetical protein
VLASLRRQSCFKTEIGLVESMTRPQCASLFHFCLDALYSPLSTFSVSGTLLALTNKRD